MNKLLLFLGLVIFFSSCSISKNNNLSADEIWENYLKTIGDIEQIKSFKSLSYISIISSPYGQIVSKTQIICPDKIYREVAYPNKEIITYIINGDKGVVKTSEGIKQLPINEIEANDEGLMIPEIYYKEFGYPIKLADNFKSNRYFNIIVITENSEINYFIKKSNFNLSYLEINGIKIEILKTNIVNGINFTKNYKTITQKETLIGTYDFIEFNPNIDTNIFQIE